MLSKYPIPSFPALFGEDTTYSWISDYRCNILSLLPSNDVSLTLVDIAVLTDAAHLAAALATCPVPPVDHLNNDQIQGVPGESRGTPGSPGRPRGVHGEPQGLPGSTGGVHGEYPGSPGESRGVHREYPGSPGRVPGDPTGSPGRPRGGPESTQKGSTRRPKAPLGVPRSPRRPPRRL